MNLRRLLTAVAALTVFVFLVACGSSNEEDRPVETEQGASASAVAEDGEDEQGLELSPVDAARAYREFEYMSSSALFLLFEVRDADSSSISSADGTLTLSWQEVSPDLNQGLFRVRLDGYSIPEDSPFAPDAVGYEFSGTYEYDTRDLQSASISADLALRHPDTEAYPVTSLALDLSDIDVSAGGDTKGDVIINGAPFAIGSLGAAQR